MDQGNTRTNESGRGGVSRRAFIAGTAAAAVGVAAGLAEGSAAYAAPSYTKVRKLPGEFRRKDTQYTLSGTPYEVIDVTVQGDNMRLFVPHASPPSLTASVAVVWYYHSNGGAYTDLSTAFKYGSDPLVDDGVVSVCPENGGTHEFASPKAVTAHRRAIDYVVALWRISYSFGRANSGGGSLMCWAFGNNFVPRRHGMYLASAVYDMEDIYTRDPVRVGYPYGYNATAVRATNAARLPQSAWAGMRIRASYSTVDQILPPPKHCLALTKLAAPVAVETSLLPHGGGGKANGHYVSGSANKDMVAAFQRWADL